MFLLNEMSLTLIESSVPLNFSAAAKVWTVSREFCTGATLTLAISQIVKGLDTTPSFNVTPKKLS